MSAILTFRVLAVREGAIGGYNQGTSQVLNSRTAPRHVHPTATPTSVKSGLRRAIRVPVLIVLVLLFLGSIAPFISAGHFRGRIQQALELSLGRKVHFNNVRFTLFSGPGFSLEEVTIDEDPRYGLEPFAYVPTLHARLRIDKLLLGRMSFANLHLVEPNLNLVKRTDGTWNVVELVQRLSTPPRLPLNLFPAMEVSGGRIDFKFGTRKTTLYIADADLAIYPQRVGKLYIRFSGSPARTDRAGNGFGHLRGSATAYLHQPSPFNQFEADLILDPSNLSEVTTLFEGHDIGVHGTVSSRAHLQGALTGLNVSGELRLKDVHRWDLLPASGEDWRIQYHGGLDLLTHRFDLETSPLHPNGPMPILLQTRATDFLTHPAWSLSARFDKAPVQDVLPLARRMGLVLPQGVSIRGTLDGVIGFSNSSGFSGGVLINDLSATLPSLPPLSARLARATVSADSVHLDPARIETSFGGVFEAGGDYNLSTRKIIASLSASEFPVNALKSTTATWFGAPPALAFLQNGNITGELVYSREATNAGSWSGQFQFFGSRLTPPGLALPLEHSEGRVWFDDSTLDLSRFAATLGPEVVRGSYRYNALAKRPERIRLELPSADFKEMEAALNPALRAQDLLARLGVTRRVIPAWLAARNLEGDLTIRRFWVDRRDVGALSAHFVWQGAGVDFSSLQLNLPEGSLRARGTADLSSYSPRYRFTAQANAFPWRGGLLNADGQFETYGTGLEALQHLRANGTFQGEDLNLSTEDSFSSVSGLFDFSFADGWPNLRLSDIQASDGEDAWNGAAASQSDGKLVFDLEHAGRQRRVISTLVPENPAVSSSPMKVAAR